MKMKSLELGWSAQTLAQRLHAAHQSHTAATLGWTH